MANTRDIRRRIKSVKNTAQITKAMQLVAASKMKKAQDQALSGRHYADLLNQVLVDLKAETEEDAHPLLQNREGGKELMLVVTTDKGLCGALNTNLLRLVIEQAGPDTEFVTVGIKGRQALSRMKKNLVADFVVHEPLKFGDIKAVGNFIMDRFTNGEVNRVRVAFTNFINTLSQEPMIETLLPINPIDLGREKDWERMGEKSEDLPEKPEGAGGGGFIFEPSPERVLNTAVPLYVNYEIYQMVLESRASEHSSRMVAMKSATDNANELIKDLSLEYNKLRQAAITNELLEITTAMKALE